MSSSPISLPKGGGSVSGLGEKFSPDLFTGTGNFSVPIALPPGRNGFQPELGLQYSTGGGNTPFGLGWNLSVPGVMRKTAKGIPQYDDEKDTFILSGAEDLVAVKNFNIKFIAGGNNSITNNEAGIAPLQGESGIITQYRPRTEGLFARIYHLKTNLRNCWKVMSKNGLTSWYGSKYAFNGDLSLVQKPDYPTSIFAWKLTLTEDTFGSPIIYAYEKEQQRENEYHIWDQNYLKEIQYADYPSPLTPGGGTATQYMVRVLFHYEARKDEFSDYKSGFDIRTTQRCKDIQIFTNPLSGEILTRTYHFQYSDEVLPADQLPYNGSSLLCKVEVEGHSPSQTLPQGEGLSEFLPPLEFRYTHFKPKQQKFRPLKGKAMPLSSLANPGFELIDLFGNAMPDIVEINGVVRYWRNMGNGTFDEPRIMKNAPTGFNLGDPDVQLIDANGDGRTDLLVNGTNLAGYFSVKYDGSWDTKAFKKYQYAPSFSFADPEVKLLDLTGDGITDVLRNGNAFECFFQDKDRGWAKTKLVQKKQLAGFPNVSFADPRVQLADMTGDGMQDIVLINSGSIKYWANLGYGNFAKPVVMKNAPRLPQSYDPARLQLADIDGDGQADLIFVDSNKITFWINQSGNGWSEPFEISGTPFVTNVNGVRIADIYGSGVSGILYSFDAYAETQRNRWFFLDLTGGTKPYLLHEMDNNMGAITRVSYQSSTRYYLKDQYGLPDAVLDAPVSANETPAEAALWKPNYAKRQPWKTTLPFPVQVVSRVDVIDQLSKGKLSTRYLYHHGYWDGGEREFRGFGRVDQQDTETFLRYNTPTPPPQGTSSVNPASGQNPSFNSSFIEPNSTQLDFDTVGYEYYSPPTETRNWFHLGPVGDEFGEWFALNFSDEYWSGDPSVLQQEQATFQLLQNLPHRARRDALRAWRGSSLRSELYALDEQDNGTYTAGAGDRPFTVSESQYGIRLEAMPNLTPNPSPNGEGLNSPLGSNVLYIPKETSGYVFFSFATSSRTTQWERGSDPMTQFSFTADYDAYGQARKQLSAALPRGIQPPYSSGAGTSPAEEGNKILSTVSVTSYASPLTPQGGTATQLSSGTYIVDRVCRAVNYEVLQQQYENVFALKARVLATPSNSPQGGGQDPLPNEVGSVLFPIIGLTLNYYDAPSEFGAGLPLGQLDKYGALARTETLVLTDDIIQDAYGTTPIFFQSPYNTQPDETDFVNAGYPAEFYQGLQNSSEPARLGYIRHQHSSEPNYATGWYAESGRTKYDWQDGLNPNPKGLVLATKDVFGARSSIEYDSYLLLPVTAKQWLSSTEFLATTAEYDYRVLQAKKVTDPNGNRAVFDFSPLGLLKQSGVIGKYGANEGDIISEIPFEYKPSVLMEYDFFAFINDADPVWVKTIQREKHYQQDHNSPEIIKVEYTDGFGRLLQTRTQAEDVIFGDPLFGDSGLPEQQGQNGNAVGVQRGALDPLNVVVSGWKIYNNKGKVVEQYEPFFDKGFDYSPPFSLSTLLGGVQSGAKIKMYYDPRGNVIRTVNPDNSEQWVIYGKPNTLSSIAINNSWSFKNYAPTPWESYTYDANDNAGRTNTGNNQVPLSHYDTPSNSVLDALGRVVKASNRLDNNSQEVTVRNTYDIQGNLIKVIDPKGRIAFLYSYDLQKQNLKANQIDSGNKWNIADATGKPIQSNDEKGAQVLTNYDTISRPVIAYAKDNTASVFRFSQVSFYGDATGIADNLNGKLYKHYDEAGVTIITHYDFKGNVTSKYRQVIKDSEILSIFNSPPPDWDIAPYRTDWNPNGGNFDTHAALLLDATEYETDTEYDALNRATKITLPEDINSNRKDIEPTYNNAGALEKITYDETEYVQQIAYNAKGQQILVAWNNDVMIRFAYDKKTFRLKRVKAEKYTYSQSGNTQTYAYNSGTTRYDQAYLYDLVGNVTTVSDKTPDCGLPSANDSLQRLFEYDAIYRLIYANGREQDNVTPSDLWQNPPQAGTPNANNCRSYNENYEYDLAGNLLNVIHSAQSNNWTRHYNYSGNTNKHSSIDDGQGSPTTLASYTYDNAGNQTNCNTDRKYIWGATNQLVAFIRQAGTSEPSVYAQYLYDATGNRVKKVVRKQGGQIETVTYIDGIFEYHTKVTTSTSEEKNYTLIQGGIEVRTGSFSDDGSEAIIYTISDYLSSAVIRLTDNGSILDKEEYYPYGDTSLRTFGKKRYRFTGKERDDESGLYYYGARYYEAWSGKFLSIDPMIAKMPAQSPYCYANGNPLVFNDPSGMEGAKADSTGGGNNNISSDSTKAGSQSDFNSAAQDAMQRGQNGETVSIKVDQVDGNYRAAIKIGEGDNAKTQYFAWSDQKQQSVPKLNPELGNKQDSNSNVLGETTLGQSALAVLDSKQREGYINKVEKTGEKNLQLFDETKTATQGEAIANKAVTDRNNIKAATRESNTPGGKALTKVLEKDAKYTSENLTKMYGVGGEKGTNLEGRSLSRAVVEASGRTNPTLKILSRIGKVAGWVGAGIGVTMAAIDIYNNPTSETVGQEVGGAVGGFVGSTMGTALVVSAAVAVGITMGPVGWAILAISSGVAGGIVGSYFGDKAGGVIGRKF